MTDYRRIRHTTGSGSVHADLNPPDLTLSVPLPPLGLHPNHAERNIHGRARLVRHYREVVWGIAFNARPPRPFPRAVARLTYRYDVARTRDQDNQQAWFKAGADAMTRAGVWTDDSVVTWLPVVSRTCAHGETAGVTVDVWEVTP